jgi:leucyl aminopeptidase
MTIKVIDKKTPDIYVMPFFQNEQLVAALADLANKVGVDTAQLQRDFTAEAKEVMVLYAFNSPGRKIYLLGLGKKKSFSAIHQAFRSFVFRYKTKLPLKLGFDFRSWPETDLTTAVDAAVSGALLGLYDPGLYRHTDPDKTSVSFGSAKAELDVLVVPEYHGHAAKATKRAEIFAGATAAVFNLVNTPGNRKQPAVLSDWAVKAGEEFGFQVQVMDRTALMREGMEAVLSVGQGSPHPPQFLVLEYGARTRKHKTPVIGLVGKGVTFDTGGVSLKPTSSMQYMKSDMGGAAAVLGAFMVASRLQLPVRLIGAVPIVENMIDGNAIKPGDVIGSHAGKSIEVTDTDAEGRLILADALSYLTKKEKADVLIDVATLTGSVIRALGTQAAGLFTANDQLAQVLSAAGDTAGERLWRLPMWDEYGADLKSDVADLRNFTGKPVAECISAAKFLEHFTNQHTCWAHLDIAGMAFGDSEFTQSKAATGYGIRLLVEFLERWAQEE